MYWNIPKMWEGGEGWIIGGGPSMPLEFGVPENVIQSVLTKELPLSAYSPFLSLIHDRHVIGINAAFFLGTWVDAVFFGDGGFYRENKAVMDAFPKLKITSSPHLKNKNYQGLKFLQNNTRHSVGISQKPGTVSWNLNSGAASISLAYHFGVKKIYLLGFDMNLSLDGVQHWHRHYSRNSVSSKKERGAARKTFARHLKGFTAIEQDAKRLGLEIINVSPNSKILNFERVKLSDVL